MADKLSKGKKLAIVGGAGLGATALAGAVLYFSLGLGEDEQVTPPSSLGGEMYENVSGMDSGTTDTTGEPSYFEEGSTIDEGTFLPNMGVPAEELAEGEEGTEGAVEANKPWYSLPETKANAETVELSKTVSQKANSAYNSIIKKMNDDFAYLNPTSQQPTVVEPVQNQPQQSTGTSYEGEYEQQFNQLREHTEKLQLEKEALEEQVETLNTDLASAKSFEEMYLNLLNNQATNDMQNPDGSQPPVDNGTGQTDNPTNVEPTPTTPTPTNPTDVGTLNPNQQSPNTSTTPSNNGLIEVTEFKQIANLTAEPVVIGTATQFKHLDSFQSTFYVVVPKTRAITDYFSDMLVKYTNQLLVKNLNYSRVEGYSNLYVMTATYLTTKEEVQAVQNEAKFFNERYKGLPDALYLNELAKYISGKATYGKHGANIFSPYALLTNQPVVCQAYTSYAKIFMDDRGIHSSLMSGTLSNEAHIWNVVNVDGKELYYDFTVFDSTQDPKYLGSTVPTFNDNRSVTQAIKAVY